MTRFLSFLRSLTLIASTASVGALCQPQGKRDVFLHPHDCPVVLLPLGDSITLGAHSTDGNGYRQHLLTYLEEGGNCIQYIGSRNHGTMGNNENEGHPGHTISQVTDDWNAAKSQYGSPNVVLLDVGTNDLVYLSDSEVTTAPQRLGTLIDQLHTAYPDAAVLVSQLTLSTNSMISQRMPAYNAAISGVAAERQQAGFHVLVVDMTNILSPDDLSDAVHPNDHGYDLMARAWYEGLRQANAQSGWISGLNLPDLSPAFKPARK